MDYDIFNTSSLQRYGALYLQTPVTGVPHWDTVRCPHGRLLSSSGRFHPLTVSTALQNSVGHALWMRFWSFHDGESGLWTSELRRLGVIHVNAIVSDHVAFTSTRKIKTADSPRNVFSAKAQTENLYMDVQVMLTRYQTDFIYITPIFNDAFSSSYYIASRDSK
jgi:hypothetical protein